MKSKMKATLALFGAVSDEPKQWRAWIEFAERTCRVLGYPATHLSMDCPSYHSGKIHSLVRMRKKLMTAISSKEPFNNITLTALPRHYEVAALDYDCEVERCSLGGYVAISVDLTDVARLLPLCEASEPWKFVREGRGELFKIPRADGPAFYLWGRPRTEYPTLEILKEFRPVRE